MRDVHEMVRRAAASKATVLIRGESGTGKELIARALHEQSLRAKEGGPFVAVSCAALSETLLDSELFGHEKNAFTGAVTEKKGRFEMAHGGTLFLDEIGDIAPASAGEAAARLAAARVRAGRRHEDDQGGRALVAATNADLEQLIKDGKFREDLYYRLQVIQITLPPLRERAEDIPSLAAGFLHKFNADNGRQITSVAPEAMMALTMYLWPGNVRELENVIERCVVLSDPDATELSSDLLPSVIRSGSTF